MTSGRTAGERAAASDEHPRAEGELLRIGLVGAGKISGQYLDYLDAHGAAAGLRLAAVADLDRGRAGAVAAGRPGVRVLELAELCADEEIDAVLNLTTPAVHAEVAAAAIAGGKHVYGEKPFAATGAQAHQLLRQAAELDVRLGVAPDTVLGQGVQTARGALERGAIGTPVGATAFFTSAGPESWHPDPAFYYAPGGGPLLDMGPYYLTALVHLLGPVASVLGAARRSPAARTVGSGPRRGEAIPVATDTYVTGVLHHEEGALSTVVFSFDVHAARLPWIEVYGTEGTVSVPDPNCFEGPVEVRGATADAWRQLPLSEGYSGAGRGVGLADLARAVRGGAPHRCTAEVGLHVLDVMESLLAAGEAGGRVEVASSCTRPAAVPAGIPVREG